MIEKDEIKKLASLARIDLTPEELSLFAKEFESILSYVSHLKEARTGEEDMSFLSGIYPKNVMRSDENPHKERDFSHGLLNEVPKKENGYVRVSKVIKQD
jgi:aspartyl-tRNA(Asn)/glutamyl-tRNA(Gln) amidotransferase subunit C